MTQKIDSNLKFVMNISDEETDASICTRCHFSRQTERKESGVGKPELRTMRTRAGCCCSFASGGHRETVAPSLSNNPLSSCPLPRGTTRAGWR